MLNSRAPNGVIPYLVAVGAVLVMVIVRWLLAPLLGAQLPFTTLVIAVLVAGWYGGLGPALLATGLSALLGLFLFIPPTYSLQFAGRMEILRVLLFCLTGAIAAMLGESRLRTQARAEASAVAARNAAELGRGETQRAEQEKSRAQAAAMEAEEALNQQLEVEAALRSSEARFRAMAESSPLGIYLTDPAGDCFYTNPAYQRISGLSEQEALGSGWSRAIHPEDRTRVFQEWYQAAERRIPFLSEHRFAHADGKVVWTRVNAAEITDEEQLVGYVGLVEDISQHAAAQTALRQSEERYRAFIEQTAEGVWRFELEQPVPVILPEDEQIHRFYTHAYLAECNDALAQMYGYSKAGELIGARLGDMMPRSHPQNLEYLRAFIRSGYRLADTESHEVDREGNERYFLNNLIGFVSQGHLQRAWGSQRDVTINRQAESAIQASEARFRSVFESGMIGIAFWNGHLITSANDVLLDMLGYTREDLAQGLLRQGRLTPPGYEEADRKATEETRLKGSCTPYEKEFLRKDGTRVPVLVGGARLADHLTDAVFFVLDLTARRQAEDRLRQAERIEVVGQLAGGMAHEANNQMSVVLGAASFILARTDLPEPVRQDVDYIRQAAERTASITRQLLAFSRRQILQPKVVDLNSVLNNLQPILHRTLTEQQTLELRLDPTVPPIRADPAQLDQVLLNLTINARDAMPDGGTLTIETREVELGDKYVARRPGVSIIPGTYTALVVSDTGHGMDQETMKHLFEPFFTTKAVGKGSGLGLAMVYGIVKQTGGNIWAYSEPGMGTTLKLYFPSVRESASGPRPAQTEEPSRGAGGRILIVEDDPLVREMARRSLSEAGHEVLQAADGQTALDLVSRGARVDAVLTDLAMPGMGGRELARRLWESRPGLPVVFMSGYTDDVVIRRGLLESGVPFLEKPLSPVELARKMRQVLDGGTL
jgi:two-component system, cell cycle sensor histidine kinase and response regulator CckA